MATNGINASLIRLNGLSSGLDTEAIVTSLLKIDQYKVDKQFKLAEKLEWKGDAYRSINLKLKAFQDAYVKAFSQSSTSMSSASAYNAYAVTMNTQTNAVSITANSSASAGALTISNITLATAAQVSGTDLFEAEQNVTINFTLKSAFGEDIFEGGKIAFSINGKAFEFTEDTMISEMMNQINSSDAGVTMSYSSLKRGFTITSKTTGTAGTVNIVNTAGTAFAADAADAAFKIATGEKAGTNAKATIDGVQVERTSNTFTIDGITYTLKENTEDGDVIKFSVSRDVDSVYDKIKGFIDAYNSLIAELQSKLDEEVYSEYGPLTDAEREELSETQINKWEEKAKSGLLRDDNGIRTLLQDLRGTFYSAVEGTGMNAASLGLETEAYGKTGKIVINETKLRTALANNPDQVASIFTKVSKAEDAGTKYKESGLVTRMSNIVSSYITNNTTITLESNAKAVTDANLRLDQLEDWLAKNEEKYYARFTAMETALAKLNSQTSWISSLLGSQS
ncbi:MAG TPA: flagellar filament capping protein FliD [Feifaniaceae bacterium]|nr:flagellar filament capping protein FliD [Feifaniaceae bacterium]